MLKILENFSLNNYNTFHIEAKTKYFCAPEDVSQLRSLIKGDLKKYTHHMILGGGSNVLFTSDYKGLIIHPNLQGKEQIDEDRENCWVKVAAGEDWDEFVGWTVQQGWYGLENLSLIPGNAGASPIQNIGAYGREVKDTILWVEYMNKNTGNLEILKNKDCAFGYRDSIFKRQSDKNFIITAVVFKLSKHPLLHLEYGRLKEKLEGYKKLTNKNVREAVIEIRESKLPDPEEFGNAGSFFKNPVVSNLKFGELQQDYPGIPHYKLDNGKIKIPAAWLIDSLGWKGHKKGTVGVHKNQALVLINFGGATGDEVLGLAKEIQESVKEKYQLEMEMEVNII